MEAKETAAARTGPTTRAGDTASQRRAVGPDPGGARGDDGSDEASTAAALLKCPVI